MNRFLTFIVTACGLVLAAGAASPAGDKKAQSTEVFIVDASGKEHKLTSWTFVTGTKHLSWLAPNAPAPAPAPVAQDKAQGKGGKKPAPGPAVGPEALVFTEGNDTKVKPLTKGVVTYIPITSIRSIDFAAKKDFVTVRVATAANENSDEVLTGLIGYQGTNIFVIEATTDLGELGKGTIRFERGKGRGLQSIRFPSPKPMEKAPAGRVATIKQAAKNHPAFSVVDLQALYSTGVGGVLRASPTLYFKDTIKLDLAKVQKLSIVGTGGVDFDVTLASGQQTPLVLIDRPKDVDGKTQLALDGLVGRFSGGYRVFPMTTIAEVSFEQGK